MITERKIGVDSNLGLGSRGSERTKYV